MSGPVGVWNDILGNFSAVAPSADKQPVRQQDDKGRLGLYFNGNNFLDFDPTGLPAGSDPSTFFIVARGDGNGGDGTIRGLFNYGGTAAGTSRIVGKYNAGDGVWMSLGGGVGQMTGGAYFAQKSTRLICVTHSGGVNPTITRYQDGGAGEATVVTGTPETSLDNGRIGALLSGSGGWIGYIYRVLVGHGVAPQDIIDRLMGWGAWEYDVVGRLPDAHPFKLAAPMVAGAPTGPTVLTLTGTPVLSARVGAAYAGFRVKAGGGTPPYSFALDGDNWDAGFSVDAVSASEADVTGTPEAAGTTAGLRVKVTDDDDTVKYVGPFTMVIDPAVAAPAPVEDEGPQLVGVATEGQTIQLDPGTWTGSPVLHWVLRANGTPIAGTEDATSYVISGQAGKLLTLAVTASNAAGTTVEYSDALGPVTAAPSGDLVFAASSAANVQTTGNIGKDACQFAFPIIIGDDMAELFVEFDAWWVAANAEVTIFYTGGAPIELRIEKVWFENAAGVRKPVYFNGARRKVVAAGDTARSSGFLPSAYGLTKFSEGETYMVKGVMTVPAGGAFPNSWFGKGAGFGAGRNAKCSYFTFANMIDPEASSGDLPVQAGEIVNGPLNMATGPNAILGRPVGAVDPIFFLTGDSNGIGHNVAAQNSGLASTPIGGCGWPNVGAYNGGTNPRPLFMGARGESKITGFLNHTRLQQRLQYANVFIDAHLTHHDITPAEQFAAKQAAWALARGAGVSRIACSTATPLADSTDQYRTVTNQITGGFAGPDGDFSICEDLVWGALDAGDIDIVIDTRAVAAAASNKFLWLTNGATEATPGTSYWATPDGIHYKRAIEILLGADAAPILQAALTSTKPSWSVDPSISGTAQVDEILTGADGTMANQTSVKRQWLLGGFYDIGAVANTKLLKAEHVGLKYRYRVTARGTGGYARKVSAESDTVVAAGAPAVVPVVQTAPTLAIISEEKYTNAVYRLGVGTWLNSPTEYDVEVLANGSPIAGTAATITALTMDWICPAQYRGAEITGTVIARNIEGDSDEEETDPIHLWIPGDVGVSLIDAFDAQLGVSPLAGPVASWAAPGGATATQSNSALKPAVEAAAFGGLPCLRFAGDNDWLQSTRTTVTQEVRTVVAFLELLEQRQHIIYSGDNQHHYAIVMSNENPARVQVWEINVGMVGESDPIVPVGQQGILVVECDVGASGRTKFWWNGVSAGDDASARSFSGTGHMRIGGLAGAYGYFRLSGLFDHDAVLSDADRQNYEGFFAHQFKKTALLADDHPDKHSPPIVEE